MTMTQDLFMAILAMDVYNRGYNEGITGLGGEGSAIGTATLTDQSDVEADSDGVSAGFYAAGYNWNGQTVISYRGTDNLNLNPWSDAPGNDAAARLLSAMHKILAANPHYGQSNEQNLTSP